MIQRLDPLECQVIVPPDASTLNGFRRWVRSGEYPERGDISLIEGRLYIDMSPERLDSHNDIKSELVGVLRPFVKRHRLGRFFADEAWLTNDAAGVSNEPDAMFVSRSRFEQGLVQFFDESHPEDALELRGSPDWVCEVVSRHSQHKDLVALPHAYHQANIAEYWVVEARDLPIRLTIFTWQVSGYEPMTPKRGWTYSPVFDRHFRFDAELDKLLGMNCTLRMKKAKRES